MDKKLTSCISPNLIDSHLKFKVNKVTNNLVEGVRIPCELGNSEDAEESPPVAPMSVQPTRKMKASSLGVNALKRL
ncbi:hypothetical protein NQ315_014157 [Exocentrus adspersus]|uniref:Uncharacterized protein n=1 Tax=Exocentrus adspersus TaxID=1586481 RepID=A0AAV8VV98_9CUCU|nr:hypothetical protein NQ315_014157 [Exocentrus adspersus]